jgi:hypothetical protein
LPSGRTADLEYAGVEFVHHGEGARRALGQ